MDDPLALLKDLHDLHLPEVVPWWPPAVGWWILLLLAVAIGFIIFRFRNRPRQAVEILTSESAFARLKQVREDFSATGDWHQLSADLSALLRRVAMTLSPRQEVASLTGAAWLQWLDQKAGKPLFSDSAGRLLAEMHYRPNTQMAVDAEALIGICQEWLKIVFEEEAMEHA